MCDSVHDIVYYVDGEVRLKKSDRPLGSKHSKGYIETSLNGKRWLLHRLVWFIHYGEEPAMIDHIDGNKLNNRIENLRVAEPYQSSGNTRPRYHSKTGVKGVYASGNRYIAQITIRGKTKHIGTFDTVYEASLAYDLEASNRYGEFAYLNNTMIKEVESGSSTNTN